MSLKYLFCDNHSDRTMQVNLTSILDLLMLLQCAHYVKYSTLKYVMRSIFYFCPSNPENDLKLHLIAFNSI